MPTRAAIRDTLAAAQTQVLALLHGLSPHDLERPAKASAVPGAAAWRAREHVAHLVGSEHSIQRWLRQTRAGQTREGRFHLQSPAGMPLPAVLGDLRALTREAEERLELAVAGVNHAGVDAHHDERLERLAAACPGGAAGHRGPLAPVHRCAAGRCRAHRRQGPNHRRRDCRAGGACRPAHALD